MANVLQIADALYAEDKDAKTLAQRVATKLESGRHEPAPAHARKLRDGPRAARLPVRYVGMVQDMGNPEFYAPSVAVNGTDVCVALEMNCAPARTPQTPLWRTGSPSSAWRRRGSVPGPLHQSSTAPPSTNFHKRRSGKRRHRRAARSETTVRRWHAPSPTLRDRQPKPCANSYRCVSSRLRRRRS